MARVEIPGFIYPEYVPPIILFELPDAVERALDAGAQAPLEYVGAGAYGIVLCDQRDHAFKVGRLSPEKPAYETEFMLESLATEYEFFRDAAKSSMNVSRHIARAYKFHPAEIAIERECVRGRPGGWADDSRLHKIDKLIRQAMMPLGWTGPEFKEDSFIIREDGTEVLVDGSMAARIGMNLASWVEDVLDGRRQTHDNWQSLAYHVMDEIRHSEIPKELGYRLIDRLNERDPKIKPGFGLKGPSMGAKKSNDGFERFHSRLLERRLLKHQYAKKLVDPKAVAVCLHKPETEHQYERWYAVTPGFPYDEGAWRISVWDKHGPSTHYSSAMHHGPFLTILQAVDDVLFNERRARIVEYILPSGEHIRVGKGPSCF